MGTNFYVRQPEAVHDHPQGPKSYERRGEHVGKRSAAGLFCWDCNVTLCSGGNQEIHTGKGEMLNACPKCGKTRSEDPGIPTAAGVELGFSSPRQERPTGVHSCSSFNWAMPPIDARDFCEEHPDEVVIVDEYGRGLLGRQFLEMLRCNCPIEFTDAVGHDFS